MSKNSLDKTLKSKYLFNSKVIKDYIIEGLNLAEYRIDVGGTWSTGWNAAPVKMYLTQVGNLVTGNYDFNNGKVVGILEGNVLEGAWAQENSNGNFRLVFSEDGNRFQGNWGYGKENISGGPWYGRRIEFGKLDVTGIWDTNYNEMYLEQRENTVVGQYKKNQGRVEGVIEGSTVIGTWFENRSGYGSYDTTGRFRFIFNVDNTFIGTRGINESLVNEGPWNGRKVINEEEVIKPTLTIDTTGTWDTNFNRMNLLQTGFNVSGEYEFNDGKLVGVIFGDTMTGTWYEDEDKDGNYELIGKFNFVFSSDVSSFKGNWGYGNSFTNGGLWNGIKVE